MNIEITGLNELIAKLDTVKFEKNITGELKSFGADVARTAKETILQNIKPSGKITQNEGYLAQGIGSQSTEPLSVEIFDKANYAAYVEFGTGPYAANMW